MEEKFLCPHCGSENSLWVDFSEGKRQEFTLDCETCCRPVVVTLTSDLEKVLDLQVKKENG